MTYGLPNSWADAKTRLSLLEQCHDATTIERLTAVGVREGWRCLEVGAGGGSIASWLAVRVGASGSVHAVDRDCGLLELDHANMTMTEADLTDVDFDAACFDLVHARLVLMFIPQRLEVLEKLVRSLRPNGVLVVEEYDCYPVQAAADEPFRSAAMALVEQLESLGASFRWGRTLPVVLRDHLNLGDIIADEEVPLFCGSSTMANFLSLTWKQILEDMRCSDTDSATMSNIRSALNGLSNPRERFRGFAFTGATGVKK